MLEERSIGVVGQWGYALLLTADYNTTPGKLTLKGGITRNWRGAALARHLKTWLYSCHGVGRTEYRVKQAAPANCPR